MDQCTHCTAKGSMQACAAAACSFKGTWWGKEMIKQRAELRAALTEVMTALGGGKKSCGHEYNCVCPYESAKQALKNTAD